MEPASEPAIAEMSRPVTARTAFSYLQLASAATASKQSTTVAVRMSRKNSISMAAPFQVIRLTAIMHSRIKPDVTMFTVISNRPLRSLDNTIDERVSPGHLVKHRTGLHSRR
jgi:hypothetical protein